MIKLAAKMGSWWMANGKISLILLQVGNHKML